MDPITTAIVAALPALASDMMKASIKDAYEGLKAAIRRKWGEASPAAKAVESLESNPSSNEQAEELAKNIATINATADADVMHALAQLVDELKKERVGSEAVAAITINITGGSQQGIIGGEHVSVGSMSFGAPPTSEKRR